MFIPLTSLVTNHLRILFLIVSRATGNIIVLANHFAPNAPIGKFLSEGDITGRDAVYLIAGVNNFLFTDSDITSGRDAEFFVHIDVIEFSRVIGLAFIIMDTLVHPSS